MSPLAPAWHLAPAHFGAALWAPHLRLPHPRQVVAQPPSAAAVTTAAASALAMVKECDVIASLLVGCQETGTCFFAAVHAPHLALQAPHLVLALALTLALAPHFALQALQPATLVVCFGPHLAGPQPAAKALPLSAAPVNTAEVNVRLRMEESLYMGVSCQMSIVEVKPSMLQRRRRARTNQASTWFAA